MVRKVVLTFAVLAALLGVMVAPNASVDVSRDSFPSVSVEYQEAEAATYRYTCGAHNIGAGTGGTIHRYVLLPGGWTWAYNGSFQVGEWGFHTYYGCPYPAPGY